MNRVFFYTSPADRQVICKEQEAQGFRMLHDNFLGEGNQLIFTDERPASNEYIDPVIARLDALELKIKALEEKTR